MKKDLAYYQGLPYHLVVSRFVEDEDGETYYCATYPRLPRVRGVHRDRASAVTLAKELFDSYVEAQLKWGEDIPEPDVPRYREPGGSFAFRKMRSAGTATGGSIKIRPVEVFPSPGPVGSPGKSHSSSGEHAGSLA
jgi:predicted RNase H-like HicB family nuclease